MSISGGLNLKNVSNGGQKASESFHSEDLVMSQIRLVLVIYPSFVSKSEFRFVPFLVF